MNKTNPNQFALFTNMPFTLSDVVQKAARNLVSKMTLGELFAAAGMTSPPPTPEPVRAAPSRPKSKPKAQVRKRNRRSAETVSADMGKIIAAAHSLGRSCTAAELKKATRIPPDRFMLPLHKAIEQGAIVKNGDRRNTTYTVSSTLATSRPSQPASAIPFPDA